MRAFLIRAEKRLTAKDVADAKAPRLELFGVEAEECV
jgi:hypothetical protein